MREVKAYKYKLKTNPKFEAACVATLNVCRELYNAALQERRDAYKINGLSSNYHAQAVQLPQIKQIREDVGAVYSQVLQDTLRRADKTFDAFFRRVKNGETPGYPRFKSACAFGEPEHCKLSATVHDCSRKSCTIDTVGELSFNCVSSLNTVGRNA